MSIKIEDGWKWALAEEWDKPYFKELSQFVHDEYKSRVCYPPAAEVFAAFNATPFDQVKVVILGQDPYHGPGQACGLAFGVNPGTEIPRSLVNIFRELKDDLGECNHRDGNLQSWAQQGVLLLNSSLTVREHEAASHAGHGWEVFTDAAIRSLNDSRENLVFILWGAYAARKGEIVDRNKHYVISSAHPSPLSASRGFFGSKPFSKANQYLIDHNIEPVKW